MDPLKALADLDSAVQTIPANRNAHAHLLRCVAVIRTALTPTKEAEEISGDQS